MIQSCYVTIIEHLLVNAGIPVPNTVVIRNWDPSRRLTLEEREKLGLPVVIKPATDYGECAAASSRCLVFTSSPKNSVHLTISA